MNKIKLNFGCGSNKILGWYNYDSELDISKKLPFADNSVDFIFNEHVIEHITQQEGYYFLKECHRILKINGVIRTTTPSLSKIHKSENEKYRSFIFNNKWGDGTKGCGVKSIIFNHGHKCVYNENLLFDIIESIGFKTSFCELNESQHDELKNIEYHGNVISEEFNRLESFSVEGIKI